MENIEKGELITTGKAKSLYSTNQDDYLVMHYRDDTSAFDGKKIESLEDYTISEISSDISFENVVGQDSLTRFDKRKKKKKRKFSKRV